MPQTLEIQPFSAMKFGPECCGKQHPALTTMPVLEAIMAEAKLCSVEGCDKPVRARGWCVNHYALWQRNGAPEKVVREPKLCRIEGCESRRIGNGLCAKHYWRWKKHGDPLKLKVKPTPPAHCRVSGCENPPKPGQIDLCNAHYLKLRRRGDPSAEPLRAPRGAPMQWLRKHASYTGDECLTWPFARHSNGEAAIGDRQSRQAARVMCTLAHGDPPEAHMQAAHSCGKGHLACVNPRHLGWKTPKENSADKHAHGTMVMGEGHPCARLSALQVKAIRDLSEGYSVSDLAEIFGVHSWTVSDVIKRKTWAWL